MHLNYGKVATLIEVQSGSMFVSAKTARLGSEESFVPKSYLISPSKAGTDR